jgi:hypothetical protein
MRVFGLFRLDLIVSLQTFAKKGKLARDVRPGGTLLPEGEQSV